MKTKTLNADAETHRQLLEYAQRNGLKIGWLINRIIQTWLDNQSKELPGPDPSLEKPEAGRRWYPMPGETE